MPKRRRNYPWWVQMTLIGGGTRGALTAYMILSIILLPAFLGIGVWLLESSPKFKFSGIGFIVAGLLCIPSAIWYWLVIQWMHRNREWKHGRRR